MKIIIISLVFVFMFLAITAGYYIWNNKEMIVSNAMDTIEKKVDDLIDLPPYGEKEYIRSKYGDLLDRIDKAADNSDSHFKFGASIEELKLPSEFVYVGYIKDKQEKDIIKRFNWSGNRLTTKGEFGAGYLKGDETIDVMIYKKEDRWKYMDSFVVYIQHMNN